MSELYQYNRLRGFLSVVRSFAGELTGGTMLLRDVLQWFNSCRVQYLVWIRYSDEELATSVSGRLATLLKPYEDVFCSPKLHDTGLPH